jgi:hypothetical protein
MRIRTTLLIFLAHSGSVRVTTEIPVVPTTQVCIPGVVSLPSFILNPFRSTRRFLQTRVAPLPLMPLTLYLRLPRKIPLLFSRLLACLLVLALLLLGPRPLQLPRQFPLLFSLLLPPLLQLTTKTKLGSLRLNPQICSSILQLLVMLLLVLRFSPPLLSRLGLPPVTLPTYLQLPFRSLQTTLRLPQTRRQRPRLHRLQLQQKVLARLPRKRLRNRRRCPLRSKFPLQFCSCYFDDYIRSRQLCYDEWRKETPEAQGDEFERHWKSLSRSAKAVSDILPPHLNLSHTSRSHSEIHDPGEEVGTYYYYRPYYCRYLILCFHRSRLPGKAHLPEASVLYLVCWRRRWVGG